MGKHLVFATLAGHGHVNPTLPLVEELVRRGHRIDYATQPVHSDAVAAAGARWVPLPRLGRFVPQPGPGPEVVGAWLRHLFAAMRASCPELLDHCRAHRRAAVARVCSDPIVRDNLVRTREAIRKAAGAARGADLVEDHIG